MNRYKNSNDYIGGRPLNKSMTRDILDNNDILQGTRETHRSANQHEDKPAVFVSSFQPDMYQATGRHLVASFLDYCSASYLCLCIENFSDGPSITNSSRIRLLDITSDPILRDWLDHNADIIPQHLGGSAAPCGCHTTGFGIEEHHVRGCMGDWYNRNASRWFRKLIALNTAAKVYPAHPLIWIDCDCRFKCAVTSESIASWFSDGAGFYFKSPQRRVMESGVFGIHLARGGEALLNEALLRYTLGTFRNDPRWDDGYQLQKAVNCRPDIRMLDLSPSALSWRAEVIATSPVGKYLEHYRGTHGPVLHLMT